MHGYDGMTDYYDVALKQRRHAMLLQNPNFAATEGMLEDQDLFDSVADEFAPDVIVHLAAQAGVRYSLENPRAYLDSNVIGTFNVMEAARRLGVQHLLMASTSSVYGANTEMPFIETEKADTQLTIYAATKKANESMGHAYAHLYDLPTTMFRFFTVYGPWGRPDLALYKFVDAILDGRPIDIYNNGDMYRDFTYVDDLVHAIHLLIDAVPVRPEDGVVPEGDNLSPVAPSRSLSVLEVHTDVATSKVVALKHNSKAAFHVWLPSADLQIRMTAVVEIQTGTDTDQQWDRIPEGSRISYGTRPKPGTAISDVYAYEKPSDRERFAVLRCNLLEIDLVHLGARHRRARYISKNEWAGTWLAP